MATINVMSSNSTYLFKGAVEFDREATFRSPVTLSSNYLVEPLETATSDSTMKAYGVSLIGATTGAAVTVGIAAPITGVRKSIICTAANSSDTVTVYGSTAIFFGNAAASSKNKLVFTTPGSADLIGISTAIYGVLAFSSTNMDGTTTAPTISS